MNLSFFGTLLQWSDYLREKQRREMFLLKGQYNLAES